jgi:hypothetical protein
MSESARVDSIDALKQLRAKLCEFGVDALESLAAVEMELRHTEAWLSERLKYWLREVRDRGEDVSRAKASFVRHRWGSKDGKGVGTTEVEMELKKAKHRLEEAEAKAELTRRWIRELPRAVHEYEGPARQLMGYLEADLKQDLAMLDRMSTALEAYVALTPPSGAGAATGVETTELPSTTLSADGGGEAASPAQAPVTESSQPCT